MIEFKLDLRLQKDCFILAESDSFVVLLMNNSLVPWFIVVPKTDYCEIYQLDDALQSKILAIINQISRFISAEYKTDKLNVASIGNIVNQMHIHIVGRYKTDPYWPGVVWGASEKTAYELEKVKEIKMKLNSILEM